MLMDVRGGATGWCTDREDYLMIRDGTSSGRHLGIFCSPFSDSRKPSPIVSITNKAFVMFHSNERDTGKGFLISFMAVEALDSSDYVADQLTFKPSGQRIHMMTTSTIDQQTSESTGSAMSSNEGSTFLPAQKGDDLTTIDLPFESIAFGNPSRGPVLYVTQEGSTVVTKTFAPPIATEARQQTVRDIPSPNPTVEKQSNGFSQPVSLESHLETPQGQSHSESQATEHSTELPSFTPRDSSTLPSFYPDDASTSELQTTWELFVTTEEPSKPNSSKTEQQSFVTQPPSRTPLRTTQTSSTSGESTQTSTPWDFNFNLDNPSGELQSPNYPDAYPMGVVSRWNITVSPRGTIVLNFTHFDLDSAQPEDSPCDEKYAYVKVEDGSGQGIKHMFCGHKIPPLVSSSSNTLIITFVSGYGYGRGFQAHYIMQKQKVLACGGSFHQPSGRIQTPNVPDDFESVISCQWNISVDTGRFIVLNFTTFDVDSIPMDNWCSEEYDHVKIEDGFGGNSYTYCGQELPPMFVSSSNTISITFVRKLGYSAGFGALYRVSEDGLSQSTSTDVLMQPSTRKPLHQCGGNLSDPRGVIQSPLLSEDVAMDIKCQWKITAPVDQIIHLTFTDFIMDSSFEDGQCDERYSHVEVDSRSNTGIGQKQVFCGTEIPPLVVTSSNTLTVTFISAYGYGVRFRAEYVMEKVEDLAAIPDMSTSEPLCGGSFHQPSGRIDLPNLPDDSEIGVSCYWNITVDVGQVIIVNFTAFDLDSVPIDERCIEEYDHLKIQDGFGGNSYTYCGQELPPVFVSSSNTIGITFVRKLGFSGGFSAFYRVAKDVSSQTSSPEVVMQPSTREPLQQCGGNLNTPRGVIQSPVLSEDVAMGLKCQWNITTPVGQIIVLTFTDFIMDSSVEDGQCDERYSHVEVDGGSSNGIGGKKVFCGTEIPPLVVSSSNTLTVTLISGYGYGMRFRAEYVMEKVEDRAAIPDLSTSEPLCGGSFYQLSGRIHSPNFPDDSEIGVSCYWNITVDIGQVITINFTAFDLDSVPIDERCNEEYDHLKIQDGFGGNSYTYCGQELPPVFVSSSNTIGITFVRKLGYSGGFSAFYRAAKDVSSQTSSPEVLMQPSTRKPLQQCGGNLNTPRGVIQSPVLSEDVGMGLKCQWNITGPVGQIIVLTFTDFIMDSSVEVGQCDRRYSHVEVDGGRSSGIGQKQVFCGTEIPPLLVSSSNTLTVTLIRGYGYGMRFRAEYVMEKVEDRVAMSDMSTSEPFCGGSFHQPSGRIHSPNLPDDSEIGVSCYWNITVDIEQVIIINFTAFDLDSVPIDERCNEEYDHLKIQDGFGGNSYTYCGQELPPVFVSSSNTIGITFVSKLGYSGGFSALYRVAKDVSSQAASPEVLMQPSTRKPLQQCGGNLNTPRGVIQSPVLPEDVAMGLKCQWNITAPVGQIIVLTFTDFIMDSSVEDGQCDRRYSHVEVDGGSSSSIGQKQVFCGTKIPPLVVSSSNTLTVTLISGYGYGMRFRAEYVMEKVEDRATIPDLSTSESLCGGSFHQPSGRIDSPNLPDDSEIGVSCYWNITVDAGQVITINFTAFDLDSVPIAERCNEEYDHLKIQDGFGGNSYTYCGQELPPVFVSSSNTVGITFVRKLGYSGGFSLLYRVSRDVSSKTSPSEVLMQPSTTKPLQQCGGNLNTPRGVIQSPLLSEDVGVGLKCQWNITAPVGQIIVLTFTDFIMDSSIEDGQCDKRYSHVEVDDGRSTGIGRKQVFCGSEIPPLVMSSSNTLIVTLVSGYGYGMRFRAEYVMQKVEDRAAIPDMSTTEPLCGGSFHQPSGRIHSPNLPDDSEIGVSCYWNIAVDVGQVIVINFTAFDLDSVPIDEGCNEEYDHLKIQDGLGGNSYTYCGQELPPVFVSSSNTIGITFVSKLGYSGGFSALYRASKGVSSQTSSPEVLLQPSTTKPLQQCGGNLNTPRGVIQSPVLSEDVAMGLKCQWNITAPVGQIIVLTFTDFIMDSSVEDGQCDERYSHVKVDGGSTTGISRKQVFCGTEIPPLVVTSSNTLTVTFIIAYGYGVRFRAEYVMEKVEDRAAIPGMSTSEPLCGGSFHQPSGRIDSPNLPDDSEIGVSCYWNIAVDVGQVIVINFTAFDLDSVPINERCNEEYDHLKIQDGLRGNSYTYCGQELPPVFVSSSNTIGITFVRKLGYSGGFSLLYRASNDVSSQTSSPEVLMQPSTTKPLQQCGGNLNTPRGVIQSPVLSEDVAMGLKCQWNITAPVGQIIVLTFTDFIMDSSIEDGQCDERYSHVEVDGGSSTGIGGKQVFCGTEIPPLVVSSSNTLTVTLISGYGYGMRFRAEYVMEKVEDRAAIPDMSTSEPLCGGSFHQPSGSIDSPNFPDDSESSVRCYWNITVDVGQVIVITFTAFDLDSLPIDEWCNEEYDHLKIQDGLGGNSYTYCGQELPPVFVSSSNTIGITFVRKLGYFGGFSAFYRVAKDVSSQTSSPEVLMQPSTTKPLQQCGGNLNTLRGVIQSPVLSGDVAKGLKCQWNITAPVGQIIILTFTDFIMDSSVEDGQCDQRYSHVEVDGGSSTGIGRKQVFCGTEIPPLVVSSSNTLTVTLISGYGYGMRFRAEYVMVKVEDRAAIPDMSTSEPLCGGSFHQPSGSIHSPNFPDDSEIGVSCYWNITVDIGEVIIINFIAFDLDSLPIDERCNEEYDHLKIQDGLGGNSYTYCGQELPPVFVSSSNTIGITFVRKLGYSGGFSALYRVSKGVPSQTSSPEVLMQPSTRKPLQQCGGNQNTSSGVIQSPVLSEDVAMGLKCQWNITAPVGQIIVLTFTDFIMDSSIEDGQCDERYSHVEVDGGSSTGIGRKQVFCGTEIPPLVVSSSNTLTVTLISGYGYGMRFRAEYVMVKVEDRAAIPDMSTSEPLCGGSFHQPSGRIDSPNFPDDSESSVRCYWNITVDVGHVIVITFTAFDLDSLPINEWCNEEYDHLKILDGLRGNSHTYCGQELPPVFVSSSNTIGITFVRKLGYSGGFSALYRASKDVSSQTSSPEVLMQPSTTKPLQQCGGNLNTLRGVIQSPVLPGDVAMGLKCQWNITAPVGQIIILTFTDFIMDSSVEDGQCDQRYSHVEVDGGSSTGIGQKQVFCGTEIPPLVVSSSNTLTVTLISGYGYGLRFRAEYVMEKVEDRAAIPDMSTSEPLCGGSFHQPSGRIQLPNIPDGSESGVRCYWNITVDVRQVIVITFTAFDLDSLPIDEWCNEEYDHLKIQDGLGGNSYTYCGQELPPVFVSSSNTISITFVSRFGYSGGFSAQFSVTDKNIVFSSAPPKVLIPLSTSEPSFQCGGILNRSQGDIHSPQVSDDLKTVANCQWNITVAVGRIIVLNFIEFDLDSIPIDNRCDESYAHVKILDLDSSYTYCGQETPPTYISSKNTILVRFESAYGYSGGFRAYYSASLPVDSRGLTEQSQHTTPHQFQPPEATELTYRCGGNLNEPSGVIEAPDYEKGYLPSVHCRWNITVDAGWVIVLNFTTFELDSIPIDGQCDERYAHIKVVDTETLKYILCGWDKPPVIVSDTRTLIIEFFSNFGIEHRFLATYAALEPDDELLPPRVITATPLESTTEQRAFPCGGLLSAPTGEIHSPDITKQPLEKSVRCEWKITVLDQLIIVLTFTDFDLDSFPVNGNLCDARYDYVSITDGEPGGPAQLFCGRSVPDVFVSSTNTLIIAFVTHFGYGRGFSAYYTSVKPENRFIATMSHPTVGSALAGTASTPLQPALPYECGGNLNKPNGVIQSPNVPEDYVSRVTCTWNITVGPQSTIALSFLTFELDSVAVDDQCDLRYTHMSVTDGRSESVGVKHVYCGQDLPDVLYSSSNTMIVEFVSYYGLGGEFYISYASSKAETSDYRLLPASTSPSEKQDSGPSVVTDKSSYVCGGNLDSPSGVIQFPDIFPAVQGQAITCRWTIRAQVGWVISLSFTFFNLDSVLVDNQCDEQYAYVKVIDGEDARFLFQVFCGQDLPPNFVTSTNVLVIIFNDLQGYSEGFHAQYSTLPLTTRTLPVLPSLPRLLTPATPKDTYPTVCSSIFKEASGMFSSPQYPNMYPANMFCSWIITTSVNTRFVALKFLDFDVDNPMLDQECSSQYSYVRVSYHSVGGIEGTQLLCGNHQPEVIAPRSHQLTVDFFSNLGIGRGFQAAYQMYNPSEDVSQMDWSYFLKGHDDILTTPQSLLSTKTYGAYTEMTAPTGIITSPNYPAQFPQDSYSAWIVRTSQGKFISLAFEDVDFDVQTEDDGHCNKLYTHLDLTIYSSEDGASNIIICQNAAHEDVLSLGELKLEFRSSYGEGRGFKARYSSGIRIGDVGGEFVSTTTPVPSLSATNGRADLKTVEGSSGLVESTIPVVTGGPYESSCDKLLSEPEGIISSPNFPLSMPQDKECSWVIQIPGSHGIHLEFLDFALDEEVETHQATCRQESASVSIAIDGMLHEFCGNAIPTSMTSSDNMVILVFKSNSGKGAGFRMHYLDVSLMSTPSEAPHAVEGLTEPSTLISTPEVESTVPADAQTALSPAHTTSHIDVRFIGDDFTDSPDDGRDLTRPGRDRVNVPVSPPREPGAITASPAPGTDLDDDVAATTEYVSEKVSFILPEYTDQPKATGMASTDSGAVDIITNRRLRIATYVCISVAVILFMILIIMTGVCIYKRRRRHISKSIALGQTEKSYWQNYKSWAVDYSGGPGRSSRAATARGADNEEEEAEDMLKQERLV
ncbi:cubilin-like isoform X2 [Patiria miniata]|uniref:Cubilin n=1 Tax=Patiria miniata TaxID=46514 RepID=A0A914B5T7_PATMI|nr:cubilin-like isoform X2 [Patiria miniata]